jgi:hypothetical protein
MMMMMMSMRRDYVSELRLPTVLLFIFQVMENLGGMISTGKIPDLSTKAV